MTLAHVLDNPAWTSLNGPHEHFAEVNGGARRYPVDVSPFLGAAAPTDWDDVAELVGTGGSFVAVGFEFEVPPGWRGNFHADGYQLIGTDRFATRPFDEAVLLGEADVDDMLDLTGRTRPGPFLSNTYLLGNYLGVRRQGRLVAMAGERLHPPGWTEISAVCTDPAFRGQGLGTRLVQAVGHLITQRGERPFMHVAGSNENAVRLYRALGFEIRTAISFVGGRVP